MRNIRILGSTELCETKCICYKCKNNCNRCDGCGDYNYLGDCDRFESRFPPKQEKKKSIWDLFK